MLKSSLMCFFTCSSFIYRTDFAPSVSATASISVVHQAHAATCYLLCSPLQEEKHLAVVGVLCFKYAQKLRPRKHTVCLQQEVGGLCLSLVHFLNVGAAYKEALPFATVSSFSDCFVFPRKHSNDYSLHLGTFFHSTKYKDGSVTFGSKIKKKKSVRRLA